MSDRREPEDGTEAGSRATGTTRDGRSPGTARRAVHLDDEAGRAEPGGPTRLGHFVILEHLGRGGMGVVYSAYDPKLDRRVALKLIRPSSTGNNARMARNRLLREAQALARISHPNIVPVHDVGVIDDRVFVVMELVDGQTLRAWVREEARTWQEILAVYRQAGEGLAAAHRLGVVHRDFKPGNAILGKDMRVRVIDFGLARAFRHDESMSAAQRERVIDAASATPAPSCSSGPGEVPSSGPGDLPSGLARLIAGNDEAATVTASGDGADAAQLGSSLTATRGIVGTPAYMSPEQCRSARVGPATDQFSFCVSLYEALYGRHPFAGGGPEGMRLDRARPPGKAGQVPGWVHAVLCRGLETDPARRYPSMQALLCALARDPARERRRKLLACALCVLALVSIASLPRAFRAGVPVCQGADQEVARIWNAARRGEIQAVFSRTGSAYARISQEQVLAGLDRYAGEWARMHTEACQAHQRGEQSDGLLDRRMVCLARRLDAMDSAVTVLGTATASSLPRMVEMVQKLTPLDGCADSVALMAEVPPPDSPGLAAEVVALRQRLHHAEALEHAGSYRDALHAVTALGGDADVLGYGPLLSEVLLVHGRILIKLGQSDRAVEILQRAAVTALAANMKAVGVEAIARLVYAEGVHQREQGEDVLVLVPYAEALVERVSGSTFAYGLLLNNAGIVHLARGAREQAHAYFERALAVKERDPHATHVELIYVLQNLAMVTPDDARRRVLMQRALRELDHALGRFHPMALSARLIYSRHVESPTRAIDVLEPVCEAYERYHPELYRKRFECQSLLGALYGEGDDPARASAHLIRAAGLMQEREDAEGEALYQLVRGNALYFQGAHEAALAAFQAARDLHAGLPGQWWLRRRAAEVELGIGLARIALGQERRAIASLEAALAVLEEVSQLHRDSVLDRALVRARLALARACAGARRCKRRALELLSQVDAAHHEMGADGARLRDETARHRRAHEAVWARAAALTRVALRG